VEQDALCDLDEASDSATAAIIEPLPYLLNDGFSLLGVTDPPKIGRLLGEQLARQELILRYGQLRIDSLE